MTRITKGVSQVQLALAVRRSMLDRTGPARRSAAVRLAAMLDDMNSAQLAEYVALRDITRHAS